MNTRLLFVIGFVVVMLASWFFARHGEISVPLSNKSPSIDYSASQIQAVQTNGNGETEYTLVADSLTHDADRNQDVLSGIDMQWQPDGRHYQLTAETAVFDQETGDMQLSDGFSMSAKTHPENTDVVNHNTIDRDINSAYVKNTDDNINSVANLQNSYILIHGYELSGNTEQRLVMSNQPVQVIQGDSQFTAESMQADLNTGNYEFKRVNMEFMPSVRRDQPLF